MTEKKKGKCWPFIKKYWYVPFFILGLFLFWLWTKGRCDIVGRAKAEVEAIRAGAEVKELKAKLGTEAAKEQVKADYAETLKKLDEDQKAKALELENDPVKLSKFLVRAGSAE